MAIDAAVLTLAPLLLILQRTWGEYGDESDNLLGGTLIARGYRLYADYFSQHMPLPYYVAAVARYLGAHDLVGFRVFFSVLMVGALTLVVVLFRGRISPVLVYSLVLTAALGYPMFSGQMFLADHFFALALLLATLLVLVTRFDFELKDQVLLAACIFVAVQSTLISIYPFLLIGLGYVARRLSAWRRHGSPVDWWGELRFAAILAAPHLLLVLGLWANGTLGQFWEQAVVFNQRYYSRYELASDPATILVRSVAEFGKDFATYLRPSQIREVEFFFLLSNLAAVVVLARRAGWALGAFYLGLLALARMRGNSGYHGSPYWALTALSIALVLTTLVGLAARAVAHRTAVRAGTGQSTISLSRALVGIAAVAYAALALVFYRDIAGFYRRVPRGTGQESPYGAVVRALTSPGERIWAAPFEPYVYLTADRVPASPYWYFFPWMRDSETITRGLLRDLQDTRPSVIVFRGDKRIGWYWPLPTPREYAGPVYAFIEEAYEPLDAADPILRNVYLLREAAPALRARFAHLVGVSPPDVH